MIIHNCCRACKNKFKGKGLHGQRYCCHLTDGSAERIAPLDAIAQLELYATDMALGLACRLISQAMLKDFGRNWLGVADDESLHFMLSDRLDQLCTIYDDLPAYREFLQAADVTKNNLLARLELAPLVLGARGVCHANYDGKTDKFWRSRLSATLNIIITDEVGHVAFGKRWFH